VRITLRSCHAVPLTLVAAFAFGCTSMPFPGDYIVLESDEFT
jgi:hypothetical protein